MENRHLVVHLEDSPNRQAVVHQALMEAGYSHEDIWQTADPQEALNMIRDFHDEILIVITDNHIEERGDWAEKVVAAAHRAGVQHILVYSSSAPNMESAPVITKTADLSQDRSLVREWAQTATRRKAA